jgi:hypothetical protein
MKARPPVIVRLLLLLSAILWLASAPQLFATGTVLVFNSFGPGNTYNQGVVWAVGGVSAPGGYRGQAEFFVPGISGYLSSVQLATFRLGGSALSDFFIAQDSSGIPGAVVESFSGVQNASGLLTINSVTQPLLQAGQKYWLCDEPDASNSYNGWYENNQNLANGFAFERSEWSWSPVGSPAPTSGVFSVSVTPVPEPSTFGLLLLGVGLLAARCRRREC